MDPYLKGKLIETALSVLGLALTALIAVVGRWIHQRTSKSKLVAGGGWLWDLAMSAVADVGAGMSPSIRQSAADGTLSASDRAMLKAEAIALLKDWLGAHGIKSVASIWSLAEPKVEAFLSGYIERALGDFKAVDVSNAPVLSSASTPV